MVAIDKMKHFCVVLRWHVKTAKLFTLKVSRKLLLLYASMYYKYIMHVFVRFPYHLLT